MNVICLRLKGELPPPDFELWLDELCRFSPRVVGREGRLAFLEVSTVAPLFGGTIGLLHHLQRDPFLLKQTFFLGVAPSAAWAQVMTHFAIARWHEDVLSEIPLSYLLQLEGVEPLWPKIREVEEIIDFFEGLGFETLDQLREISLDAYRGRWRQLGERVYKVLHFLDRQVISARTPREPLVAFHHFDDPVAQTSWLLKVIEEILQTLLRKMQRRNSSLRRLQLILHLEYSGQTLALVVEPLSASRNSRLILDLVAAKVDKLSLENPVRQLELFAHEIDERTQQLDFLNKGQHLPDRLERLLNIAHQESVQIGFWQVEDNYLPEKTFSLQTEFSQKVSATPNPALSFPQSPQFHPQSELLGTAASESGLCPKEWYGAGFYSSPRPSLLLPEPVKLSVNESRYLQQRQLTPTEFIESPWFTGDFSERRYFFSVSRDGRILWLFEDSRRGDFFLHGYWD